MRGAGSRAAGNNYALRAPRPACSTPTPPATSGWLVVVAAAWADVKRCGRGLERRGTSAGVVVAKQNHTEVGVGAVVVGCVNCSLGRGQPSSRPVQTLFPTLPLPLHAVPAVAHPAAPAMTSVAGRKKSIIATPGPSIDMPVPNNTALNKAASQSTSLYQQCSALRTRLMRVHDFSDFFNLSPDPESSSSRRSTDPVTQLWDCFALGVPLCYLFNQLNNVTPLSVDTASFDPTNEKTRKRAIAQFAMGCRQIEGCGTFTVTDLWDRSSTDGFVKVRAQRLSCL